MSSPDLSDEKMVTGRERVGELRSIRAVSAKTKHVACLGNETRQSEGLWGARRQKSSWDTSQRASSVLLRRLDFIPLPLKVIPLRFLKGNHLVSIEVTGSNLVESRRE